MFCVVFALFEVALQLVLSCRRLCCVCFRLSTLFSFIASVCGRLLSVVVGCSLFRLFHALSSCSRLSRLFELF